MTTSWTPVSGNSASWSDVAKPLSTTSVITEVFTGGEPIGLLLALTYTVVSSTSVLSSIWTPINDNATSWTGVPKAT